MSCAVRRHVEAPSASARMITFVFIILFVYCFFPALAVCTDMMQ